ncbi:AzlC family ABC transporter permease [Nitriliruptor alkaliphilus]|uniref:AzlC family ABC transporter permease n=1 Tax=Nitriliruptor alkaliphilus TaxID=427918 RepID=UPI0006991D82|nr:AzlC family ABC transporter permease [Nitriliruptor alkaliphilus]
MNRTIATAPATSGAAPGWSETVAVGLAVGAYGLSYGVLATAAGLSPAIATLSSLLVLAGGSQFAFVAVLAAGGNPLTGAIGGLLLNVRYVAFGLAISRALPRGPLPRRLADAYLVVDESVALAVGAAARGAPPAEVTARFRRIGASVATAWIVMTAVGAYGGQLIGGDPEVFGLDAAFPAGFVALLAPWLRSSAGRRAAAAGALLAVALTPFVPAGLPLLAAALGAFAGLRAAPDAPRTQDEATDRSPTTDEERA